MLRDQSIQWPWYDGGINATRKITPDIDPQALHTRLVDTLKQSNHAGDAITAALSADGRTALGQISAPTLVFKTDDDVRYQWADDAACALSNGATLDRPADQAARALAVLSFLGR